MERKYRRSAPPPADRTLRWIPTADAHHFVARLLRGAGSEHWRFFQQAALAAATEQARAAADQDVVGLLLGGLYVARDGMRFVVVDAVCRVLTLDADAPLTAASWEELREAGRATSRLTVGWYRSRSHVDVRLPADEEEAHVAYFGDEWQSALVVGRDDAGVGGLYAMDRRSLRSYCLSFHEVLAARHRGAAPKHTAIGWRTYRAEEPATPLVAETRAALVPRGEVARRDTPGMLAFSRLFRWRGRPVPPPAAASRHADVAPSAPRVATRPPVADRPVPTPAPARERVPGAPARTDTPRVAIPRFVPRTPAARSAAAASHAAHSPAAAHPPAPAHRADERPAVAPAATMPSPAVPPRYTPIASRPPAASPGVMREHPVVVEPARAPATRPERPAPLVEAAEREGFVLVGRFDATAAPGSTEVLWVLHHPELGALLEVLTSGQALVDASVHYNVRAPSARALQAAFPEHRDLTTETLYVRESCAEGVASLTALCRRLRQTDGVRREWVVCPQLFLITPSEWAHFANDGGAESAAAVRALSASRLAVLPAGVLRQTGLATSADRQLEAASGA